MDYEQNTQPATPAPQPAPQVTQTVVTEKKGHGALITFIVLLILVLAALFFWKSSNTEPEDTDDFTSLQADLEATNIGGVSDGL